MEQEFFDLMTADKDFFYKMCEDLGMPSPLAEEVAKEMMNYDHSTPYSAKDFSDLLNRTIQQVIDRGCAEMCLSSDPDMFLDNDGNMRLLDKDQNQGKL